MGNVTVEKDIVFGQGNGIELMLDVYRAPEEIDKHVAVIQVYGGGFNRGSKERHVSKRALELAERGYTGVCINYRLADVAKWPAQVHDTKAGIRWVRANAANLNIDPEKIVIAGYSAGGQLAMVCAGSSDDASLEGDGGNAGVSSAVAACIAFYPSFTPKPEDGTDRAVMTPGSSEAEYRATHPLSHIKPGYPPTILFFGSADRAFNPPYAISLFNAIEATGSAAELHMVAGLPHIFDEIEGYAEPCNQFIVAFLDRYVIDPRVVTLDRPAPVAATA